MKWLVLGLLALVIAVSGCISESSTATTTTLAVDSEDISICENLEDKDYRLWCIAEITRDIYHCEEITNKTMKDSCYSALANIKKDPNICKEIENPGKKDHCYSLTESKPVLVKFVDKNGLDIYVCPKFSFSANDQSARGSGTICNNGYFNSLPFFKELNFNFTLIDLIDGKYRICKETMPIFIDSTEINVKFDCYENTYHSSSCSVCITENYNYSSRSCKMNQPNIENPNLFDYICTFDENTQSCLDCLDEDSSIGSRAICTRTCHTKLYVESGIVQKNTSYYQIKCKCYAPNVYTIGPDEKLEISIEDLI